MNWLEVLEDKSLQDLPYKIETNEYGQIVMSPSSRPHARFQTRIAIIMASLNSGGEPITECPIETDEGVKVPDVIWDSNEFTGQSQNEATSSRAPAICVEVISPSNSPAEIAYKRDLYFRIGAKEVWTCDLNGVMQFFTKAGPQLQSTLFPTFPSTVVL